ncbi:MAG: hypothetical protein DRO87_09310, partial [Candidatus Thorarchaeota archaeon]
MVKQVWFNKDFSGGLNLDISPDLLNNRYSPYMMNTRVNTAGVVGTVEGSEVVTEIGNSEYISNVFYFVNTANDKYVLLSLSGVVKALDAEDIDYANAEQLKTFSAPVRFCKAYNYAIFGNIYNGYYRWNGNETVALGAPEKPVFLDYIGGNITGNYTIRFKVTYVIDGTETAPSEREEVVIANATKIGIKLDIPIGPTGTEARKIYMYVAGRNSYRLYTTINNNTDQEVEITDLVDLGNSSLTSTYNPAPYGKYIAFFDTRVWIANTTESPTAIYFSEEGTFNHFVADNYIDLGLEITGIIPYKDQLIVFTEGSTYAIISSGSGYVLIPLIQNNGAYENSYAIANGSLYWMNKNGIWQYSGASLSLTSEGSTSKVAIEKAAFSGTGAETFTVSPGHARSWLITTQEHWEDEYSSENISTSDVPGSIILTMSSDGSRVQGNIDHGGSTYEGYKEISSSNPRLAKPFTAASTFKLKKVTLTIDRTWDDGTSGSGILYLCPDNSGEPDYANPLGVVYVDADDIPTDCTNTDTDFDFTSQDITLDKDTKYWLVLEQTVNTSDGVIRWAYGTSSNYNLWYYEDSSSSWKQFGDKGNFWSDIYAIGYTSSGHASYTLEVPSDKDVMKNLKIFLDFRNTSDYWGYCEYVERPYIRLFLYAYYRGGGYDIYWGWCNAPNSFEVQLKRTDVDYFKVKFQLYSSSDGIVSPIINAFKMEYSYTDDEAGDIVQAGSVNDEYWLSVMKTNGMKYTLCKDRYGRWYMIDQFYNAFADLGNRFVLAADNENGDSHYLVKLQSNVNKWRYEADIDQGDDIATVFKTAEFDFGTPSYEKIFRKVTLLLKGDGSDNTNVDVYVYTDLAEAPYRAITELDDTVNEVEISLPTYMQGKRLQVVLSGIYYYELHGMEVEYFLHKKRYVQKVNLYDRWILDTYDDFANYVEADNVEVLKPGLLVVSGVFDNSVVLKSNATSDVEYCQTGVIGRKICYMKNADLYVYDIDEGKVVETYDWKTIKRAVGITSLYAVNDSTKVITRDRCIY